MDPSLLKLYDDSGQGPLHAAVFAKRSDIAQLLLDHRVPVDSKDFAENSPLHLAALHHCDAVIRVLLNAGAAINLKNAEGQTPLRLAISPFFKIMPQHGQQEHVKILLEAGGILPEGN